MRRSITRRLAIGGGLLASCVLLAALCLGTAAVAEAGGLAPGGAPGSQPAGDSAQRVVGALRWAALCFSCLGVPAGLFLIVQVLAVWRGLRASAGGPGTEEAADELAAVAARLERQRRADAALAHAAGSAGTLAGEARRCGESTARIETLFRRGARLAEDAARGASLLRGALHDAGEAGAAGLAAAEEAARTAAEAVERLGRGLEGTRALEERTARIEEAVAVIADVADQTELLSLNAAIEAARADEAGRGFSVVALEVRKLADRSARAASGISELVAGVLEAVRGIATVAREAHGSLAGVRTGIERTATSVQATVEGADGAARAAERAAGAFESLRGLAVEGVHLVTELAEAGRMSAAGIADIHERLASWGDAAAPLVLPSPRPAAATSAAVEVAEAEEIDEAVEVEAVEEIEPAEAPEELAGDVVATEVSSAEAGGPAAAAAAVAAAAPVASPAEESIEELESVEDAPEA